MHSAAIRQKIDCALVRELLEIKIPRDHSKYYARMALMDVVELLLCRPDLWQPDKVLLRKTIRRFWKRKSIDIGDDAALLTAARQVRQHALKEGVRESQEAFVKYEVERLLWEADTAQ